MQIEQWPTLSFNHAGLVFSVCHFLRQFVLNAVSFYKSPGFDLVRLRQSVRVPASIVGPSHESCFSYATSIELLEVITFNYYESEGREFSDI